MRIQNTDTNETVQMEIGKRLRDYRIARHITQKELAEQAGIALRTLINLEGGRDVKFSSLLSVLRQLDLLENVGVLVAEQGARPSDLFKLGKKRQRATPMLHEDIINTWTWGDDK